MGALASLRTVLATPVADGATVTIAYPSGQTQQTLMGYGSSQILVASTVYHEYDGQFDVSFGASSITLTNRSKEIWPIGRVTLTFGQAERRGTYVLVLGTAAGTAKAGSDGGSVVEMIGGVAIGATGSGIYAGKTLRAGDDFVSALDIVTPANPAGRYLTTRAYMLQTNGNGPRGASGGLVLKMYDVDPAHTGHNDAGRGNALASWADAMSQSGGLLKLKARRASTAEKLLFEPTLGVNNIGAMVHSAGDLVFKAPFLIEFKATLTKAQSLMGGFHPTFWLMQMNPPRSSNGLEFDWEGESDLIQPNYFVWTNGVSSMSKGSEFPAVYDGQPHTYGLEVDTANNQLIWYLDGAVARTVAYTLAYPNNPFYWLVTAHIADFPTDPYVDGQWQTGGDVGAGINLDYVRVWDPTSPLRKPLIAAANYEAASGAPFSFVLPTSTAVWGSELPEIVEGVVGESNSPGGNYNGGFSTWPAGVSYDAATRTLSGTLTTAGTLIITRYPTAGGSAKPHRSALHVGPRLAVSDIATATVNAPYSFDLYAMADCGQLTSNASGARAKTLTVSGLPAGLSYSDATGLITGTATAVSTNVITVTIQNSRGQQVTATANLAVTSAGSGYAPPVTSGLVGSLDPEVLSSLTTETSGSDVLVTSIAGADGTSRAATGAGANRPTLVTRNGKKALRFASALSNRMDWGDIATAQGNAFTRISILEFASGAANQCVIETSDPASSNVANRTSTLAIPTGGEFRARRASAQTSVDAGSPVGTFVGRHVLIEDQVANTGPSYIRTDRQAQVTAAASVGVPTGATVTTIGSRRSSGVYDLPLDAWVWRELVYSRILTAAEKLQIIDWATTNYGTP